MTDPDRIDIDEVNTNELDPLQPRPIDRPTALPLTGQLDPLIGDIAKIFAAPDAVDERPAWREALHRWRREARERLGYRGAAYDDPALEWTQGAFAVALVWLWDERLFDRDASRFTPEVLLAGYADAGGLDGVVLWHAYPVIGIDNRNQFDFYRDVPGIDRLVADFQARGVRVFVNYNPWDVGTRRTGHDDARELAGLVRELGVDGVFLDTLKEADAELISVLRAVDPPQALEGESRVPLERVEDHQLSWAQWFADSPVPGVLRAHWYERRHMLHSTRRWNRDHHEELQTAWLNGTGMLIWDAVFGVWVGWNRRDRSTLARMLPVQRALRRVLIEGDWDPLAPLDPEADAAGVYASRFRLHGVTLWTVVNRAPQDFEGTVVVGREPTTVPAHGVLAIIDIEVDADPELAQAARQAIREHDRVPLSGDAVFPARDARRVPAGRSAAPGPGDATAIRLVPGTQLLSVDFRRRETGLYGEAPYVEEWKPLPPRLHDDRSITVEAEIVPVVVASAEVSVGEYRRFATATGRAVPSGDEEAPVAGVTLDDARRYAESVGARLPTEFEWQLAASDPRFTRREPRVWNWTESEHSDGVTRFVILKGGSDYRAEGSDWYFDGGMKPPGFSAKYLLAGLGLEASANIGFRLAWDLPATEGHAS